MSTQQTALLKTSNRSGGPRTVRGKANVRLNSVTHGLRSQEAVVLGERTKDWKAHLAGIIASLKPVGSLEEELAEQVATITWRMRRVLRYESGVMSGRISSDGRPTYEIESHNDCLHPRERSVILGELETARRKSDQLTKLMECFGRLQNATANEHFDANEALALLVHANEIMSTGGHYKKSFEVVNQCFLTDIGVPPEERGRPELWDGWTATCLMRAMMYFGRSHELNAPAVISKLLDKTKTLNDEQLDQVKKSEAEMSAMQVEETTENSKEDEEEVVDHDPIMDPTMLNNVMRYGGHLRRELNDALETLNRLQTNRRLVLDEDEDEDEEDEDED